MAPRSRWWRLLPAGLLLLGFAAGFAGPYLWAVDRWLQGEFGRLSWQEPTRVYARPLRLTPRLPLTAAALELELAASGYRENASGPGSYTRDGGLFRLHTRGFVDADGRQPAHIAQLVLKDGRVLHLADGAGKPLAELRVDPARIATFYGADREERRLLRLQDVPPLVIAAVQAVEDRSFKDHHGIDALGILRAAWNNLRAGEVRQGGSTLTQQLVRNLYLSREQSLARKLREAVYAMVIEARFSKARILEVYLNQVYLGQQGSQAVHGLGAGAGFWFGRELDQLGPAEVAMLVGLIQGPSHLDPRRYPERARARRDRVLAQLLETGVIDAAAAQRAQRSPLGVTARGQLAANSHPAFLALVHRQLASDYPADRLNGSGLTIHTTLAPMAQRQAELVVAEQLAAMDQAAKGVELQAALVLSDTRSGTVEAVVGDRDGAAIGFNRALDARRPVGSLLKPFVYLLALAQPERWSLAALVEDAPITVRVSGGQQWTPDNVDKRSHGRVPLQDALTLSYNQATVRVGLDIGVDRLSRLIEVLTGVDPPAHPSLLLGAVDLSPLQMTQLYQFIASGGELQPLRAVRAVLDAHGAPLRRYENIPPPADAGDALATRLVTLALQEAARTGTAKRLQADGLGYLHAAGKTGTSNDSRDSWFAGYSGQHLAVVWVGDDRNRPTGLYGSTGAMRLWSALFRQLPSAALAVGDEGLEWTWVAPEDGVATDANCAGAREFAFVAGYSPTQHRGCSLARLRDWLGIEGALQ